MSASDPACPTSRALVSARLCHDLISPIGAIGNGLELLQLADGGGAAELALVNDSLATALAKLRFYRVAFGPADPQARQSLDEAAQITDAMFHGRFTVTWEARGGELPRPVARLAYLAILCLEKSLPMGGNVRIGLAEGGVTLAVDGRRTAPPAALWAHVSTARRCPRSRPTPSSSRSSPRPLPAPATASPPGSARTPWTSPSPRSARCWPQSASEAAHVRPVARRRGHEPGDLRFASGPAPPCPAARAPACRRGSPCPR